MRKKAADKRAEALFVVMYMARRGVLACHAAVECSALENGFWRAFYTRGYRMEQERRIKTYINDEGPEL